MTTTTSVQNKKRSILLVEDDQDQTIIFQESLAHAKGTPEFKLEFADRLGTALERLAKGDIDLVLLDLHLPDSKGLETFLTLHRQAPSVPVVIMTSLYDDELALEAVRAGAQDFVFKRQTGDPIHLVRTLKYAIERHQSRVELASLTKELQTTNVRLEKLSMVDPLTELLNRRGLQEALSRESQWAHRDGSKLLALLIDLDDFKRINDTWGLAAGDVLLKEAAGRLKESIRSTDYVARVGGDEFMILMPRTPMAQGATIAERIRLALSAAPISTSSGQAVHVTASLGMGIVNKATDSVEELLDKTYLLLQNSKRNGKNRVSYERWMKRDGAKDSLTHLVATLVQGNSFRVVLQPIMDLSQEIPVGYEFLTRSAIKGFEMPDDFFHVCMENNILTLVDHHCLKACLKAASSLPAGARRHLNLFPSTLIGIPTERLLEEFPKGDHQETHCIEVSEKQIIGDASSMKEPIKALKEAGILIAIDDIGFGRSCLESLTLLEPDIIKIDRKCITGIGQNQDMVPSLQRLLKVAEALHAEVIAEGIETEEDLKTLKDLGVKYGQGFLWGKPT